MYHVEMYARVRRACMVEGMSVREASRVFGLHRDTVRKMLAYSAPPGYRRQEPPRRPRLEPFTGVIDAYSRHNERDRRFRDVVLRAYRSRCALCELDVQVDGRQIGIEAAHIKWHSEGGPPRVENGMVLCVLHHKFFDSGLFTVLSDLTVQVGGLAVGDSVEESLNKYGGSVLPVIPDCPDLRPASRFLEWHKRAVFKAKPKPRWELHFGAMAKARQV